LRRKQPLPMSQALADMGVGALRFPYGHLADNYLWHSPPYDHTVWGLRPRVASMNQTPGLWAWAVKKNATMPNGMDFDEYMALCGKINAKPLVCVSALSFKYPGGPTYKELKASAVAWVSYAKKKGYKVAYWQIGNEVDHKENSKLLSMKEYETLYVDFARAMKKVDPSAQIGPGLMSTSIYYHIFLKKYPELVDFVSVHQYMENWQKTCANYDGWRDCKDSFVDNIENASKILATEGRPHVQLLVTETGISSSSNVGGINNTYKALWSFEIFMNELSTPSVAYTFFWGTHTPWDFHGNNVEPASDAALALHLRTNAETPTGEILRLINGNLLEEFVATNRVSGRLRCYAMRSQDGIQCEVFLLNKDDKPLPVTFSISDATRELSIQRIEFAGRSPDDIAPIIRSNVLPIGQETVLHATLAPLSITIFRWNKNQIADEKPHEKTKTLLSLR